MFHNVVCLPYKYNTRLWHTLKTKISSSIPDGDTLTTLTQNYIKF